VAAQRVASIVGGKTAGQGVDPNRGGSVWALGYGGSELSSDRLTLSVGGVTVFAAGAGVEADLQQIRRVFEQPEIEISAELGLGQAAAEAWGCDLSEEYVHINADYTT